MTEIDHIALSVASFARSKEFYETALAPLGIKVIIERAGSAGFGRAFPHFWIREGVGTFQSARQIEVITPAHVAFRAADRDQVVAFHQAALRAGGMDIGAPGPRPQYHPGYYGAFVADPDGHNIEAVVHGE